MKYERLPYKAPGTKTEIVATSNFPVEIPVFDRPIDVKENFRRCAERKNPLWVPNSLNDCNFALGGDLTGLPDLRFDFKERCDWVDLFGCVWEWIPEAGGSMLKPGQTPVCADICDWEKSVKWPELDEERIKRCCEEVMSKPTYHPGKVNYYDFGQGCTERLVAILGGYEEAMLALALEPEACSEFMAELSRFHCRMFDLISKYFPTDMILYHDDWGTERSTFFSEQMMEDIVYGPSEIFFKHVKESGVYINLHSCGKIDKFLPYAISLGADFVQLQQRCNDLGEYKKLYGDKLGFDAVLPGANKELMLDTVKRNVDNVAAGGGLFSTIFGGKEEVIWDGLQELNGYSREFYEN